MELIPLLMFVAVGVTLLSGYPVAFCLGGVALIFAVGGLLGGSLSMTDLTFLPGRLFGIIENTSLMAVPLFVFMGVMLESPGSPSACWPAWGACWRCSPAAWAWPSCWWVRCWPPAPASSAPPW